MRDSDYLLRWIRLYQMCVSSFIQEMQKQFSMEFCDIVHNVKSGKLPKSGRLQSGASYCFHGIGCMFERGFEIEMDFGPEFRVDGFDFYKVNLFASEFGAKCHESEFEHLIETKVICCPSWQPGVGLYYIVDQIRSENG